MPRKKKTSAENEPSVAGQSSKKPGRKTPVDESVTDFVAKDEIVSRGRKRKNDDPETTVSEFFGSRTAKKTPRTAAETAPKKSGIRRLLPTGFVSEEKSEKNTETKKKSKSKSASVAESSSVNSASISAKLQQKFSTSPDTPSESHEEEEEEESEGFESVEEAEIESDFEEKSINQAGPSTATPLRITVEVPGGVLGGRKKNKEVDVQKFLMAQLKKKRKEILGNIQKVSLICFLGRGFFLNDTICRNSQFLALALSCWDKKTLDKVFDGEEISKFNSANLKIDVSKLRILVASIRHSFPVKETELSRPESFNLLETLTKKRCNSFFNLVILSLLMLRSLGLNVRLIYSFQPVPVKEIKIPLSLFSKKKQKTAPSSPYFGKLKKNLGVAKKKLNETKKNSSGAKKNLNETKKKLSGAEKNLGGAKKKVTRKRKVKDASDTSGSEDDVSTDGSSSEKEEDVDTDDDTGELLKKPVARVRKTTFVKGTGLGKRIFESPKKAPFVEKKVALGTLGIDYWLDVYCPSHKTFIPVQCATGEVNDLNAFESRATQPVQYVVAFGFEKTAKDVTAKFTQNFLTINRKLQIFPQWWKETLHFFTPQYILNKKTSNQNNLNQNNLNYNNLDQNNLNQNNLDQNNLNQNNLNYNNLNQNNLNYNNLNYNDLNYNNLNYNDLDKNNLNYYIYLNAEEDDEIQNILLNRPRPTSIQEFKGHPLYVLERHLLKYEALYPPNPLPLGEIKGESYYLRHLVQLLHTKENWLKEGRTIKEGEEPYKEVKRMKGAAPSHRLRKGLNNNLLEAVADRLVQKDVMSGLYGRWQTEDFRPPVAENGIVPRNEYGNVDLFKPTMLPIGCVYIPIKGIQKVAKKLGIDCAVAMTGWDFSGGYCHPVHDGWVVCKEYEETLLDAWNSQQFEIEQEEKDAKIERVINNWRKLIKNLMLKKRLNRKYGVEEEPTAKKTKKKTVQPEVITVDSD